MYLDAKNILKKSTFLQFWTILRPTPPLTLRSATSEMRVLGHLVDSQGIRPDLDKDSAVEHFPTPTLPKQLQSVLGFCSYFWYFIMNSAWIAEPLTYQSLSWQSAL